MSTLEHNSACQVRTEQSEEGIHSEVKLGMQYQSPRGVRMVCMMARSLIQDGRC